MGELIDFAARGRAIQEKKADEAFRAAEPPLIDTHPLFAETAKVWNASAGHATVGNIIEIMLAYIAVSRDRFGEDHQQQVTATVCEILERAAAQEVMAEDTPVTPLSADRPAPTARNPIATSANDLVVQCVRLNYGLARLRTALQTLGERAKTVAARNRRLLAGKTDRAEISADLAEARECFRRAAATCGR